MDLIDAMGDPNADVLKVRIDDETFIMTEAQLEQRRERMMAEMEGDSITRRTEVEKRIEVEKRFTKGPLVMTSDEANLSGLISAVVNSREALLADLELTDAVIEVMEYTWSETVFGFLASAAVRSILLTIGLIGIWIELRTPGFGVPGMVGILCIALLLFSNECQQRSAVAVGSGVTGGDQACPLQQGAEAIPERGRQGIHVKQVAGAGRAPLTSIRGQRAAGHDGVDVGVQPQRLAPGV